MYRELVLYSFNESLATSCGDLVLVTLVFSQNTFGGLTWGLTPCIR
jgi:hypothetical protein